MSYVIGEQTATRLREVLGSVPGDGGGAAGFAGQRRVCFVIVTEDADEEGFYPCTATNYVTEDRGDGSRPDDAWETFDDALAIGANGDLLQIGTRYLCIRAGDTDDGTPVFVASAESTWTELGKADADVPAASGSTPGTAAVSVWAIDPDTENYADTGDNVNARNPTANVIPSGSWCLLYRDPASGEWWAMPYPATTRFALSFAATQSASTSITVFDGAAAGDLVIVLVAAIGAGAVSTPDTTSTWTVLVTGNFHSSTSPTSMISYWLGYRYNPAGSDSYTWSSAGAAAMLAGKWILTGAAEPVLGRALIGSGSTLTAPGIDVPAPGGALLYVGICSAATAVTITLPAGMTNGWGDLGNATRLIGAYETSVAAGATGDISPTQTDSNANYVALVLAVVPNSYAYLIPTGTPIFSGQGPPGNSIGATGSVYFDVTDPSNPQFYFKT